MRRSGEQGCRVAGAPRRGLQATAGAVLTHKLLSGRVTKPHLLFPEQLEISLAQRSAVLHKEARPSPRKLVHPTDNVLKVMSLLAVLWASCDTAAT